MGVDYSGNYGVGVKIFTPDLDEDEDYDGDVMSWIDDVLKGTIYSFFEVGNGSYTGEENEICVCIDNPFSDGFDITDKVSALKFFLAEKGIEYYDDVDVVGGLNIW